MRSCCWDQRWTYSKPERIAGLTNWPWPGEGRAQFKTGHVLCSMVPWGDVIVMTSRSKQKWNEMIEISVDLPLHDILARMASFLRLTREATLCQSNLNVLRKFAWFSQFRCFHGTQQTQNKVGRLFYNLAEFVFKYFCDSIYVGEF